MGMKPFISDNRLLESKSFNPITEHPFRVSFQYIE